MGLLRLDPAPLHRRRRHGRRGRAGRPARHLARRVRGDADADHHQHPGRGVPARRRRRAAHGRAEHRRPRPDLPARGAPAADPGERQPACRSRTAGRSTRPCGRCSTRSGRPASWPSCPACPTPASAAATSRRSSTSRRAARTRRPPAGSTARCNCSARGPRSARSPPGGATPLSLLGPETTLAMDSLNNFTFPGWDGMRTQSQAAVAALYRGHVRHARRGRAGHARRARHGGDRTRVGRRAERRGLPEQRLLQRAQGPRDDAACRGRAAGGHRRRRRLGHPHRRGARPRLRTWPRPRSRWPRS